MYVRKHGATAGEVSGRERRCSSTAEGEPAARAGKRLGAGRLGACGRGGKRLGMTYRHLSCVCFSVAPSGEERSECGAYVA